MKLSLSSPLVENAYCTVSPEQNDTQLVYSIIWYFSKLTAPCAHSDEQNAERAKRLATRERIECTRDERCTQSIACSGVGWKRLERGCDRDTEFNES